MTLAKANFGLNFTAAEFTSSFLYSPQVFLFAFERGVSDVDRTTRVFQWLGSR